MKNLIEQLHSAQNIILSTHRECDGDGLGAEIAFFHALKKMGKKQVTILNVDPTPRKYEFLLHNLPIQYYESNPSLPEKVDLSIVFDTNDERQLGVLSEPLKRISRHLAFVDHHPILLKGPQPTRESFIDVTAASTGELVYRLVMDLKIELDEKIAEALYTSLVFDTQLFRYIRSTSTSHEIAAHLLKYFREPEKVHRALFGGQTVQKMAFLAKALGQIEFFAEGKLAMLRLRDQDLFHYNVEPAEARDVIDLVMNIESLEAAALFREDAPNEYKLSLRSKGRMSVLSAAEAFGGGGHHHSSGASLKGTYSRLKEQVIAELENALAKIP